MLVASGGFSGLSPMLRTHAGYYGADVQTIRNYERSRAEFRKILVRFQGMGAQARGPVTTPIETVLSRALPFLLSHFPRFPHFLSFFLLLSRSLSLSLSLFLSLALTLAELLWRRCLQVTTFLEMLCEEYRRCEQVWGRQGALIATA